MLRFDWYIVRRLITGYALLIGILIVFFIVVHYSEHMDDFHDRAAPTREVFLAYYPNLIPEIIRLVSPLALFLTAIHLTGRLAQSMQLVALQSSGVSLYRILRPYAVVGIGVTVFMFFFNGWVVPQSNRTVLDFEQQYLKDQVRTVATTDIHRQNRPGSILTVSYYDRAGSVAHRISLQEFDDGNRMERRIDSPRMEWIDSLSVWRLREPVIRTFDQDGRVIRVRSTALDTTLNLLPDDLARSERDVESMTITDAAGYLEELRRSGIAEMGRTMVAYYDKFAYPVANLILIFIALPIASVRRRGGQAAQIGIGLGIAFLYLALQKLAEPFGYSGELHPAIAAWLPHVVFAIMAVVILTSARK